MKQGIHWLLIYSLGCITSAIAASSSLPTVLPQGTVIESKSKIMPSIDLTLNPSYKSHPFEGITVKDLGHRLKVDYGKTFNYLYFGLEASSVTNSYKSSKTEFNNFNSIYKPKNSLGFAVRAGAVMGETLTYFKIGISQQRRDLSTQSVSSASSGSKSSTLKSRHLKSLSPGVGFETKVGESLSVGAEYSYIKRSRALNQLYGSQDQGPVTSSQARHSKNDFNLKLRYRF